MRVLSVGWRVRRRGSTLVLASVLMIPLFLGYCLSGAEINDIDGEEQRCGDPWNDWGPLHHFQQAWVDVWCVREVSLSAKVVRPCTSLHFSAIGEGVNRDRRRSNGGTAPIL